MAGNTIREERLHAWNTVLPGIRVEYTVQLVHHDVIALPNGHSIEL